MGFVARTSPPGQVTSPGTCEPSTKGLPGRFQSMCRAASAASPLPVTEETRRFSSGSSKGLGEATPAVQVGFIADLRDRRQRDLSQHRSTVDLHPEQSPAKDPRRDLDWGRVRGDSMVATA